MRSSRVAILVVFEFGPVTIERAPLMLALQRAGAQPLLGTAWLFPEALSVEDVEGLLASHLPASDGCLLTVTAGYLLRPASAPLASEPN